MFYQKKGLIEKSATPKRFAYGPLSTGLNK